MLLRQFEKVKREGGQRARVIQSTLRRRIDAAIHLLYAAYRALRGRPIAKRVMEAVRSLSGELDGLTVGLLDISKARGDVFLDRLEALLGERGAQVKRYRKPTFSKPAPIAFFPKSRLASSWPMNFVSKTN